MNVPRSCAQRMQALRLRIPAKINWSLDITGKRADGYHNLRSVFQAVSIYDYLTMVRTDDHSPLRLTCNIPSLPCDARNLVMRAARRLLGDAPTGLRMHLEKHIPSQAGMGGGSADCAAALLGLRRLYALSVSDAELHAIATALGADVPFFLHGGTVLAEGIGERLTPLPPSPTRLLVVAKGRHGSSTPAAYGMLDALPTPPSPATDAVLAALSLPAPHTLFAACGNAFDAVIDTPEVTNIRAVLQAQNIRPVLSGSGAAVFGGCTSIAQAATAQLALLDAGLPFVAPCQTLAHGIQIQTADGWETIA